LACASQISRRGDFYDDLPEVAALSERARELPKTTSPATPSSLTLPYQERGVRKSRALPYVLHVQADAHGSATAVRLSFLNSGYAGAVFHVYDRLHLERAPRRYTVEALRRMSGVLGCVPDAGAYDLWVLGPNGFHRRFSGTCGMTVRGALPEVNASYGSFSGDVSIKLLNRGLTACTFAVTPNAYFREEGVRVPVAAQGEHTLHFSLHHSAHWYDLSVRVEQSASFLRRLAGRVETGRDGYTDPENGGYARVDHD
jgi:phospholipase C